uniref:Acyl-homoserine-lactone synthase n=1 Tax=Ralstonia syzygii R24 TaxID=907261 RepID=G3A9G1_9RALS|nr:acyl-homoserine-lactone synthase (Autoinducer synthesis protein solI) [Ralstonia syzygii R24]
MCNCGYGDFLKTLNGMQIVVSHSANKNEQDTRFIFFRRGGVRFIFGDRETLKPAIVSNLGHYRYKVFVERLKWHLPCEEGRECDQFDRTDTMHLIALGDREEIVGCARLLPTTRPYLLESVFPALLNGQPPPSSPQVWELSRFAAVDFSQDRRSVMKQFSVREAVELMRISMVCAKYCGARKLVTVSPMGVERLLAWAGFSWVRAGRPLEFGGELVVAGYIDVA